MSVYIRDGAARTAEVQDLLRFLGYCPINVALILEWIDQHDGDPNVISPHVRVRDMETVAGLLRCYSPAVYWPDWTDADCWEPTDSDRQWWSRQTAVEGGVPCNSR
jgi:hypothetical protein